MLKESLLIEGIEFYQVALWEVKGSRAFWQCDSCCGVKSGSLGLCCFHSDHSFLLFVFCKPPNFMKVQYLYVSLFRLSSPLQIGSMIWFLIYLRDSSAFPQEHQACFAFYGGPTLKLDPTFTLNNVPPQHDNVPSQYFQNYYCAFF